MSSEFVWITSYVLSFRRRTLIFWVGWPLYKFHCKLQYPLSDSVLPFITVIAQDLELYLSAYLWTTGYKKTEVFTSNLHKYYYHHPGWYLLEYKSQFGDFISVCPFFAFYLTVSYKFKFVNWMLYCIVFKFINILLIKVNLKQVFLSLRFISIVMFCQ